MRIYFCQEKHTLVPPLYLVPGNRDDNAALRKAFRDKAYLPEQGECLHYTIALDGLRLVGLDSTAAGERKGVFDKERQLWLEGLLGGVADAPAILFIHHPPFDVDDHYVGGYRRAEEAAALADIVSRHRQVKALICGHEHWLVECEWAGVPARVMPSVAVDLRKGVDETAARGRPIYLMHHLEGDELVSEPRMVDAGA